MSAPLRSLLSWTLLLLALTLGAARARAQCGTPDGLDGGPCCSPASLILPTFPAISQDMRWLCFDTCQTSANNLYCVQVGAPIPLTGGTNVGCGEYSIRFVVRNCGAAATLWNGRTKAHYSRTWTESSVPGAVNLQVWRFLINGDFAPTQAVPVSPCDRPQCMSQYSRIYFTGYIDYAFDCITNTWQATFALEHGCDRLHHAPSSARPAPTTGLHPTRSFTMVSPGAGFVPAPNAAQQANGPMQPQSATRWNHWGPAPGMCMSRENLNGTVTPLNVFCVCASAGSQYVMSIVQSNGTCGTSVNPSPLGPFQQKRIGGWTNAAAYPGLEFLLIDMGNLVYTDGCSGAASDEWFEGVTTIGGFPAMDAAGLPLGTQFLDYGSSNKSGTNPNPLIGAPHVPHYMLDYFLP